MPNLPPDPVRPVDPKWLAERLKRLAAEGSSLSFDDMPQDRRGNAKGFGEEWAAWFPQVSRLLRAQFEEPSPVYWAIANADRRLDDIFAEPESSFEKVKGLYLEAIELALKTLRTNDSAG